MSAVTEPTFDVRRTSSVGDAPRSEASSPFYRVSVKGIVFDGADRLLVVQEPAGHWELPGGGWEHGEGLEDCLARELREELGVRLDSVDISSQRAWTGPGARRRYHRLKLTVHATLESTSVSPRDEVVDARWVTPGEFADLPINPSDADLRDHILAIWPGRRA